jgi:2-C-methyl-D-erythritol 4-phosphate cytidylyltransferase
VVAAGSGARFGAPKQYEHLGGKRVVDWSLELAREVAQGVVLVAPSDDAGRDEPLADVVVVGGATRSASVRAGLRAVPVDVDTVLVHDAARPVPCRDVWRRVLDALAAGADAAVPAVPVTDTLRHRDGRGVVDRDGLVAVQTPQGFRAEVLRAAHRAAADATDDAALVDAIGGRVTLVDGDPMNVKITSPSDLALAEVLVR